MGPYTWGQLKSLWTRGEVNVVTFYRTEGSEEWKELSTIANLLDEVVKPTVVTPQTNSVGGHKTAFSLKTLFITLLLIAILIFSIVYNTNIFDKNIPANSSNTPPEIDPVESLKRFSVRMPEQSKRNELTNPNTNMPSYTVDKFSNISYDVQKTDSLVSPYVGIVSFRYRLFWKDENEDRLESRPNRDRSYKVTLSFQNKKWVPKETYVQLNESDWEIDYRRRTENTTSWTFSNDVFNSKHGEDYNRVAEIFEPL